MNARGRFRQLCELRGLQQAERALAALDHAQARFSADDANAKARHASECASAIAVQWYANSDGGFFEPEQNKALGGRLVAAEADARVSAQAADRATALCDGLERQWRLADARSQATDRVVRDARREILRAEDEIRMDQNAARVLDRWRQG